MKTQPETKPPLSKYSVPIPYYIPKPTLIRTTPAPKPIKAGQGQELTEAELADYARKIALLHREIGKHQAAIAELRNEQYRLLHEITVKSDLSGVSIGICGLCGFTAHEGECLDA